MLRTRLPIKSNNINRLFSIKCNDIDMVKLSIKERNYKYDYVEHINKLDLEHQKKLINHNIKLTKHIKKLDESIQLDLIKENILNIYHFNITKKKVIAEIKSLNAELKYRVEEMDLRVDENNVNHIHDDVYIEMIRINPFVIKIIKNPSKQVLQECRIVCDNLDKIILDQEKKIKYDFDLSYYNKFKNYFNSPTRAIAGVAGSAFIIGVIINYPFGSLLATAGSLLLL